MTTCLGKSSSIGLQCMYFVGVCQILCVSFFSFCIEGRMWDGIVLIPDHAFLFTFLARNISYWARSTL